MDTPRSSSPTNSWGLVFEEEIKRHYANQKAEGTRLQQQVTQLKNDKTALEKDIIRIQKRIEELELQIGHDDR
jgi:predicted  nucleic acid-binding Zn-ribbon protein